MTPNHRHRVLYLKQNGTMLHLLKTPLTTTLDRKRAHKSRWVWGVTHPQEIHPFPMYVLTPLSILHTLIGLTVETR